MTPNQLVLALLLGLALSLGALALAGPDASVRAEGLCGSGARIGLSPQQRAECFGQLFRN